MKKYKMKINNEPYDAHILEFSSQNAKIKVNGVEFKVVFESDNPIDQPKVIAVAKTIPLLPEVKSEIKQPEAASTPTPPQSSGNPIKAPLPGVIVKINYKIGDTIKTGDVLLILEAMKMESEMFAPFDGVIESILVKEQDTVQEGQVMMVVR